LIVLPLHLQPTLPDQFLEPATSPFGEGLLAT
jgi:hypothetical protein